jgi:hypothetical protein
VPVASLRRLVKKFEARAYEWPAVMDAHKVLNECARDLDQLIKEAR